jgi:hypothetical protein
MALDDLERAGVTLPREEWGKREVRSTVNKPLFVATAALAVGAGVLMYFGEGRFMTWVGAGLFLLALFGATTISLIAASRQSHAAAGAAPPAKRNARPAARD